MASSRRTGLLVLLLLLLALLAGGALWLVLGPEPATPTGDGPVVEPPAPERSLPRGERPGEPSARVPREHVAADPVPVATHDGAVPPVGPGPGATPPTHSPIAPTRTVRVTVLREDGGPERGARVGAWSEFGFLRASPEDARTDVEGHATLTVTGTSTFKVRAWTTDAAAVGERINVAPDAAVDVTLRLVPGTPVAGRVLTESSTPVAGARVVARLPSDDPFGLAIDTETGPDGAFDLGLLPSANVQSAEARIEASARAYVTVTEPLADLVGRAEIVLTLPRGQIVRGRCVAAGARPVAGVGIAVAAPNIEAVETADDGRFEVLGIPWDGSDLLIQPPEHVAPRPIRLAAAVGEIDVGDVILDEGVAISGVVVDGEEKPVARATIWAMDPETGESLRSASSGADGTFTLQHVGPTAHTLVVQSPDVGDWSARVSVRVDGVTGGASGVRIVLVGGLSLLVEFKLESDRSDVEVASAEVEARRTDADGGGSRHAWTGSGMRSVRVKFQSAGVYSVTVKVPGYEPATVEGIRIDADRETRIEALFRVAPE